MTPTQREIDAVRAENIRLKAALADARMSELAALGQAQEAFEAQQTARADALREAIAICDVERQGAVDHRLPQMALGALTCKRAIQSKLGVEIYGSSDDTPAARDTVYFSDDPCHSGWTYRAANGRVWDTKEEAKQAQAKEPKP